MHPLERQAKPGGPPGEGGPDTPLLLDRPTTWHSLPRQMKPARPPIPIPHTQTAPATPPRAQKQPTRHITPPADGARPPRNTPRGGLCPPSPRAITRKGLKQPVQRLSIRLGRPRWVVCALSAPARVGARRPAARVLASPRWLIHTPCPSHPRPGVSVGPTGCPNLPPAR